MEFKEFRERCIKKKQEDVELISKFKKLIKEQDTILSTECYRPKYKIFRGHFCPVCGEKLKIVNCSYGIIYTSSCGYEYAEHNSWE